MAFVAQDRFSYVKRPLGKTNLSSRARLGAFANRKGLPAVTATLAAPDTLTATKTFMLAIDRMDRGVRVDVEKLMLLLPEGEPGEVWFTRWHRAPDGTYSCRERIIAPYADAVEFAAALEELAAQRGFVARLTQRPYAGMYD